jgi:hypothetical protein
MKTTTLPPLRVSRAFRKQVEDLLDEGETLSSMVLTAVTRDIEVRKLDREFIARGLTSSRKAKRSGTYFAADDVVNRLRERLAAAKKVAGRKHRKNKRQKTQRRDEVKSTLYGRSQ